MNRRIITFVMLISLLIILPNSAVSKYILELQSVDEETGVKFSIQHKSSSRRGPCRQMFSLTVIGEVPENVDLTDDNNARKIVLNGFQYGKYTISPAPSFSCHLFLSFLFSIV